MILRYLLDTNILSDLVRHPHGAITHCIEAVGEDRICTSLIVAAELRYGAAKRGSGRLSAQLDAVLRAIDVLPSSLRSIKSTANCGRRLSVPAR